MRTLEKHEFGRIYLHKADNDEERDTAVWMLSVESPDGEYIGDLTLDNIAVQLAEKGIIPQTFGDRKVCSIGKSVKDGKWYGWSHRAISSFDTQQEAEEFADSVS